MQEKERKDQPTMPETGKTGGQGDLGKTGGLPDWEKKDKGGQKPAETPR